MPTSPMGVDFGYIDIHGHRKNSAQIALHYSELDYGGEGEFFLPLLYLYIYTPAIKDMLH